MLASHKLNSRFGFTIVELLIVIVVIGILAAITIVAYNGIQDRARASAASSALTQTAKKLGVYEVDNPNSYPATLASIGINDTSSVSYQYTYNNSTTPATFCVTATATNISYKIAQSGSPTAGGCAGHGTGGYSAATNLATNPSFEAGTSVTALYNGATIARTAVGDAASGSYVGRIIRGTAGGGLLSMVYPVTWSANSPISFRFKVRLSPGSTSSNTINVNLADYNGGSGTTAPTGCSYQQAGSLSTSTWSDVIVQSCTTANVTMNAIGIQMVPGQSWLATDGIEMDSVMIVGALTTPLFADGNTSSWVWNGTANTSTSTGPAP